MPTMVDLCARLREPGQQQHGTLKSEGKAARANGILHVITPPARRLYKTTVRLFMVYWKSLA